VINLSDDYKDAIVADSRKVGIKVIIDISDPDLTYGSVESSGTASQSKNAQIMNRVKQLDSNYATCELNRWELDGSFKIGTFGEVGFLGSVLSGANGAFSSQYVEVKFSNVSVLQACSMYFSQNAFDGVPADFKIEVKQGGTTYFTKSYTGNTLSELQISGFTVYNPDAIRITITKWSLPYRRIRIAEVIAGIYEEWDGDNVSSLSLKQQGDVSSVTLPYGTCSLSIDNQDRRFEPRNKAGLFQSITERQGIAIAYEVETGTETVEVPCGTYYQYADGWKTSDNGLVMQWDLVDIIGLLSDREYIPPSTLPTTLDGWAASIVSQLGTNFKSKYTVDSDYKNLSVTTTAAEVTGMTIGELIQNLCMATSTWARADSQTGYLCFEPLWSQGDKITLDNLNSYPTMKANSDVSAVIFTLHDGTDTQYVVSGNSTAAGTVSVDNPFIKDSTTALKAAKTILSTAGGNMLELTGRGNPASEIGDVDTVWLNESTATTARRISQDLSFSDGVLKNCTSELLQADGSLMFQTCELITESGTWTAPSGVTSLRIVLVGGGDGSANGTAGTWDSNGTDGSDGGGAKVYYSTISINDQQSFDVTIGTGGEIASKGGATVFGAYSSANGALFEYGYTDISNGNSYARTGVTSPQAGTGDGAKGGTGGLCGITHSKTWTDADGKNHSRKVIDRYPTEGASGVKGASGCVIIYYDK
jgi:hypothetical protein